MNGDDKHDQDRDISEADLNREMARDPEFEAFLKEAATIPVPEGLADRILARAPDDDQGETPDAAKVVSLDSARDKSNSAIEKRHRWVARAASVLLLVGLVGVSYFARDPGLPMEQRILVDLQHSFPMYDAMVVAQKVDPNIEVNLHHMLETIGAKRVGNLIGVTYCETTSVDGKMAGVMVFPGKMGAVTVVFVTARSVGERAMITDRDMAGVIWPERKGSVAVLGHPGDPEISAVEERVRNSVNWF